MRREKDRFYELGARVVLVGLGSPEESAAFKARFEVPFPLIADPQKKLFDAFGLKRGSFASLLTPAMAARGIMAMVIKGHGIGAPVGDVRQLPGVFVIDTAGRIRFSHFAVHAADHPDAEVLLKALRVAEEGDGSGQIA